MSDREIWSDGHGFSFEVDRPYIRVNFNPKDSGKITYDEARALGVALLKATTTGTLINLLDEAWGNDDR